MDSWKAGDTVVCVDAYCAERLTKGKEYSVIDVSGDGITSIGDDGKAGFWLKFRFEKKETPENKQAESKMRKVFVYKLIKDDRTKIYPKFEDGTAVFHAFGCDYEEFDSGQGNYSTAIIERADGSVENVPAHMIKFIKD